MTMPTPTNITSAATRAPRDLRSHISDWYLEARKKLSANYCTNKPGAVTTYIGTVEVLIPVPKPVTTLPTMRWATVKAKVCKLAPIKTKTMASQIVRRRPSLSPTR